ncbi:GTP pyrophosphokinase [Nocardioides sp. B-3]|uniref:GTP pyrophosphokinase n=1 Tax=Nocardioides sp. B-3 TaxID=2895565 RepID=UPI00220C9617|nr:hypothetical protein LP418_06705 [Nocardioides sp. B-3]
MNQIKDQVALRVITYLPETVEATCDLIRANFRVLEEIDKAAENELHGVFGYASRHFILELHAERKAMLEYENSSTLEFEVQVRTTLQHAWAEFEHDVRYKGDIPEGLRGKFNRRFALAVGLIELADSQFSAINSELERLGARESAKSRTPTTQISPETLAPWLLSRYPNAQRSRAEHYVWMHTLLEQLGMTTFEDSGPESPAPSTARRSRRRWATPTLSGPFAASMTTS